MADAKITELSAIASIAGEDLLAVVDDPSGTPATTKATVTQVKDYIISLANTWTDTQTFANVVVGSANSVTWSTDLILGRRTAANLRLGATDAASPVAQTLSVQSVAAGQTNAAGANLTITGSQGTGSGAGGSIIFQVAPAGSSGTAQNALVDALTIDSGRNVVIPLVDNSSTLRLGGATSGTTFGVDEDGSLQIRRLNSSSFGIAIGSRGGGDGNTLAIGAGTFIGFADVNQPDGDSTLDIRLYRDAANTLALRNSTSAQAFRVYNTYTSATSFERGNIFWDSNVLKIGTEKGSAGGTARALELQTDGTSRWSIGATTGHLLPAVTNTYDIGSISIKVKIGYFGAIDGADYVGCLRINFTGRGSIQSQSSGVFTLFDATLNDFGRLQFGGTTSSFPALKRSSTTLQARLADDSDFAPVQGKLTTETAYTAGAPTATGYIVLYDSTGTAYKVPAEAL